jgi:hypothetical protein
MIFRFSILHFILFSFRQNSFEKLGKRQLNTHFMMKTAALMSAKVQFIAVAVLLLVSSLQTVTSRTGSEACRVSVIF